MRNILITGGQGYIGGRLAEFLSKDRNNKVVVTSRNPKKPANSRVKSIRVNPKVDNLTDILVDIDTVIHLAALDAQACVSNPIEAIDVNISDTLRWRIAADTAAVSEFIYFSTIHVYGSSKADLLGEESQASPIHPYAITHKSAEDYVLSPLFSKKSKTKVFRLSNAFGHPAGEISQWHLVILDFCKQAVENKVIVINSNSSLLRDFISLSEVCRAIEFNIQHTLEPGIYNLSSGVNRTLLEVANTVKSITQEKYKQCIEIVEKADRTEMKQPVISNVKLALAGFLLSDELEKELGDLIEYCRQTFKSTW